MIQVLSILELASPKISPGLTFPLQKCAILVRYSAWNLSIMVTLGPDISGLYIQVAVIEKTCIRWSATF